MREDKEIRSRSTSKTSHNHKCKMFIQHYVTQIIHSRNTLYNSCHFWINCSLFRAFFPSHSLSTQQVVWAFSGDSAMSLLADTEAVPSSRSQASCSKELLHISAPGTCWGEKRLLVLFSRMTADTKQFKIKHVQLKTSQETIG